MASRIIDPDVAKVLSRATSEGNTLKLPDEQLERDLYVRVNKVLEALGGKWNRRQRAHVFENPDFSEALADALDDGFVVPWREGYFPTPPNLVARVIELARIEPRHRVLEPSAGQGALADAAATIVGTDHVTCVEINSANATVLWEKGYKVIERDFMTTPVIDIFDRVVMNPPFDRKQEIDHVARALDMLKPGGWLVSIMSAAITFRSDRKTRELHELIERLGGTIEHNPEGSFKPATPVNTVIVTVRKP